MCTYILYHDPDSKQPLTMACTRDENIKRYTEFPVHVHWERPKTYTRFLEDKRLHLNFLAEAAEWEGRLAPYLEAGIQGPQDGSNGGTFAAINKHGVIAAINNREVGIDMGRKLARGGLALDALTFSSAKAATEAIYRKLAEIQIKGITDPETAQLKRYPAFNLIIADKEAAYLIQNGPESFIHHYPPVPGGDGNKTREEFEAVEYDKIDSQKKYLVKERIPSKEVVMLCGWGINDEQSKRTQKFRPKFCAKVDEGKIPRTGIPASWSPWLRLMIADASQGNAYDESIAQPEYPRFDPNTGGHVTWATISTALFTIDGKGLAHMYFAPITPKLPMNFQHIIGKERPPKPADTDFDPYASDLEVDRHMRYGRWTRRHPPSGKEGPTRGWGPGYD